ncbi:MAG: hypothetical protein ACJ77A_18590 [Actinomycetota bacterium]
MGPDQPTPATERDERNPGPDPGTADHFRAWVAVLIAVVSILGAVVVWRASVDSSDASDLGQQGIQQLILQQQKRGDIEAGVARDFRLFADFQEHVLNWRSLLTQADQAQPTDAALAADLRQQARRELSAARAIRPLIQAFDQPDYGNANGTVTFDPARQAAALEDADLELTGLHPARAFAGEESTHRRSLHLVGVAVLFAAALLFLTLAQVARRGPRAIFAAAGIVVMIGAGVLFALTGLAS